MTPDDATSPVKPEPRPRRLRTSVLAVVVAVAVAVPISVGLLLRSGVVGGSHTGTTSVLDLHMFSATSGWAWAGGNELMHTASGVQDWTIVAPPIGREAIIEVAWVDATTANILTTSASAINNVEQTYTLTGWRTDDGGTTWTEGQPFTVLLETGQDPTGTSGLDFVDPLHGWFFDGQNAIGAPIFIFRTVDGGLHWSQVEMTPATGRPAQGALPVGCAVYGMAFVDSTTGWVAGQCDNLATLFDVTYDGGATWSPQAIPCINCALYPPQFTTRLDGRVFGENGLNVAFVTDDGGRTWLGRASPPGNLPDFVDAHNGFTLGLTSNGNPLVILWTTADGGVSWRQAPNGAIHGNGPQATSTLDFITPRLGWAVSLYITSGGGLLQGSQTPFPTPPPELWQTTDAGISWSQITPMFTTSR